MGKIYIKLPPISSTMDFKEGGGKSTFWFMSNIKKLTSFVKTSGLKSLTAPLPHLDILDLSIRFMFIKHGNTDNL